jgi:hypothetical protein
VNALLPCWSTTATWTTNWARSCAAWARYPAKDLGAFFGKDLAQAKAYVSGKRVGKTYTKHNFEQRLHTQPGDRELLTRQEMVRGSGTRPGSAPDILVTNYSMLEYMLMRPFECRRCCRRPCCFA